MVILLVVVLVARAALGLFFERDLFMYDFIILSLPRSGSHMLASALDSHPEIQCQGEYEMIEKFPLGRNEAPIKGCIVQAYHIQRNIAPPDLVTAKLIYLYRPVREIVFSRFYGSPLGVNSEQWLTPVLRDKTQYDTSQDVIVDLMQQRIDLGAFLRNKDHLKVTYRDLCHDKDVRSLDRVTALRICDFLNIPNCVLVPMTHKPS